MVAAPPAAALMTTKSGHWFTLSVRAAQRTYKHSRPGQGYAIMSQTGQAGGHHQRLDRTGASAAVGKDSGRTYRLTWEVDKTDIIAVNSGQEPSAELGKGTVYSGRAAGQRARPHTESVSRSHS